MIIIESPDRASAEAWYASESYQKLLPLRARNSDGNAIIIDGNADDHRGADILSCPRDARSAAVHFRLSGT